MHPAAALRFQIEQDLQNRFPSALSPAPRTIREVAATGIARVDSLLDGGLPVGAISELTGPQSSGRTSLALAFVAQRTAEGKVCCWVDAQDSLDPESAAASGVALRQLLWVRCRDNAGAARGSAFGSASAYNRKPALQKGARLDQALQATDLLLQAGGFAALVLDLGGTDAESGCRIPLATWFRFRQAADRTRTCLLVLGEASYAQSSAAVVLDCGALRVQTAGNTVLSGITYEVRRRRERFAQAGTRPGPVGVRKAPTSAWTAAGTWDTEKSA